MQLFHLDQLIKIVDNVHSLKYLLCGFPGDALIKPKCSV